MTAEPEVAHRELFPGDTLILACDGIFDVLTDQQTAQVALANAKRGGRAVVRKSYEQLSSDNLTVLCVQVMHPDSKPSKRQRTV
mmetsp:Transcript_30561/g.67095  ORF Transcript_30561/g.67095 Transcript_30561/m.67095 type:complete len:84 (+) Transcript_30561:1-252(+)